MSSVGETDDDWWTNNLQDLSSSKQKTESTIYTEPSNVVFLSENCTKVTAQTGSTSILHCEVDGVGESMVSWIRRRDYQLLTVGLATYSSDERFFTAHVSSDNDWALHIKFADIDDEGLYECQVSTYPTISIFVTLILVEAKADIIGDQDKMVESGSTLELTCLLRHSMEPPTYIFWYHDNKMINYDSSRGVIVTYSHSSSLIRIPGTRGRDSGNYTCVPSNARPASVNVHIIKKEKPAAMQGGRKSASASNGTLSFLLIKLSVCVTFWR